MAYGNPQRLYAIELANGVIKVGITSRTEQRLIEHARGFSLRRSMFGADYVTSIAAESELIAKVARIATLHKGREWFTGISFDQAAQLVRQVSRKFVEKNPKPKGHLLRKMFSALRFNDQEIAVLDAYCERFGMSRSAACRELALAGVVRSVHAANSFPTH